MLMVRKEKKNSCFSHNVNWKQQVCYQSLCKTETELHNHVIAFPFFFPFFFTKQKITLRVILSSPVCSGGWCCRCCCLLYLLGFPWRFAGSLVGLSAGGSGGRAAGLLEMRLLLWDGGYFPINLKFGIVGGIRTQGGVFPSHLQVLTGSRQLLHSLQTQIRGRLSFFHHNTASNSIKHQVNEIIWKNPLWKKSIQRWNVRASDWSVDMISKSVYFRGSVKSTNYIFDNFSFILCYSVETYQINSIELSHSAQSVTHYMSGIYTIKLKYFFHLTNVILSSQQAC